MRATLGVVSCIGLLTVLGGGGCGGPRTTTVIENERIERVEQETKLVWTGKTYSINKLACNESLVSGYVTVTTRTAKETAFRKTRYYEQVTYALRGKTALGQGFIDPLAVLVFPIQSLSPAEFERHGVISRESRQDDLGGAVTELTDYQSSTSVAPYVPVLLSGNDIGFGSDNAGTLAVVTDSEGRFSTDIHLDSTIISPQDAESAAMDIMKSILVDDAVVRELLTTVDYRSLVRPQIQVTTNAKTLFRDDRERALITEDSKQTSASGVRVSKAAIERGIRDYLNSILLTVSGPKMATIMFSAKDTLSRSPIRGEAAVEVELVTGVTGDMVRSEMLRTLQRYVKPSLVTQYLPQESSISDIVRLPPRFVVGESRSFTISVPATYRLKVTHPSYVYTEGEKGRERIHRE